MHRKEIRLNDLGLTNVRAFLAHANGKWNHGDYADHEFRHDGSALVLEDHDLEPGEEFKIMVMGFKNEAESKPIFDARMAAGVMIGDRFDWDKDQEVFWLLAPGFPVVRWNQWDQNNRYE